MENMESVSGLTAKSSESSIFDFLDSAIMSCRDGLCWSEASNITQSKNMSSFVRVQDCYASRWEGHLPLAPMPSKDSYSPNKRSAKRRIVR